VRRAKLGGVRDWFRKKKEISPSQEIIYIGPGGEARRGLPLIPREPAPALPERPKQTVQDRLLSLFTAFDPGTSRLPAIAERLDIIPEGSNLPALLSKLEILPESIKASPPKDLSVSEEQGQMELWSTMFEESKEEGPIYEAFPEGAPSRQETVQEAPGRAYRQPHEDWPKGEPPLYWATNWRVPTPYETAYWIQNSPDKWDLPGLFEYAMRETDYPGWRREVEESAHTGEPAALEIDQIAHWSNAYDDLADFLEIPQRVLDIYFGEIHDEELAHERTWDFQTEVLTPYLDNVSRALDALRPVHLRGWFEISPADDYSWWRKYVEAKYPRQLG
jgi:hypothetical protein